MRMRYVVTYWHICMITIMNYNIVVAIVLGTNDLLSIGAFQSHWLSVSCLMWSH